jgi:hypothetical protein
MIWNIPGRQLSANKSQLFHNESELGRTGLEPVTP